jgi:hypothetical protein
MARQVSDVLSNRLGWGKPFVSSLRPQQLPDALARLEWWWRCVLRGWVYRWGNCFQSSFISMIDLLRGGHAHQFCADAVATMPTTSQIKMQSLSSSSKRTRMRPCCNHAGCWRGFAVTHSLSAGKLKNGGTLPHARRLLALLCAALSVAVVVAEATISPFIPNLSLFSRALHHASGNELATELLAFVFLVRVQGYEVIGV